MAEKEAADQRYTNVEDAIFGAFEILAARKDPQKITVSEIIRSAGIVRSSFYNHFEDMPSMINAAEDRIVEDIEQMLSGFRHGSSKEVCRTFFLTLCRYTQSHAYLERMLLGENAERLVEKLLVMFHEYTKQLVRDTKSATKTQENLAYAVAYSIGGVLGILHKWTASRCADPPELVAVRLTESFLHGMSPYL